MSACARYLSVCDNVMPFFLKIMFLNLSIFVRRSDSVVLVFRYSQDRMAKKMAPINNQAVAFCQSDSARSNTFRNTIIGKAFCFFFDPS